MADNSRELQLLLTVNDKMSQTLSKIGTNTEGLKSRTDSLNNAVKGLVGAYVGVQGLKSAINGTIGAAIEWETAFTGIRKTVDATDEQFKEINDSIREMAKRIPVSATELAKIGEIAGQLGVKADDITSFTETVAKLGVTTTLTTEEAASNLARIANIMQEPLDNVGKMGAVLVDLGNNFATTEREINDFALRIAGAGKIAGFTTANIFGIGAALSSVGVEAEAGGTAVQKVMLGINQAVIEGNEKLAIFARTANLSAKEFADLWQSDAASAFTRFVEGLGKQGDSAITTLSELGLEDQRLMRSFLSLANAGDILRRAIDTGNTAFAENNALNAEAEKRFATTASQIQILKNNLKDLGISMGEAFLPVINDALSILLDFANGWAHANENIKATFSSFGEFINTLKYFPQALAEVGAKIGNALKKTPILGTILDSLGKSLVNNIAGIRGLFGLGDLLGMAGGGAVSANTPYIVGERGPELFVPRTSGSIIPNGGMAGGGVNVFVYGDVSGRELVDKVTQAISASVKKRVKI